MESESLAYYLNESKKISLNKHDKKIKIALLSSFSINGLSDVLRVKCNQKKTQAQIYEGAYNQYSQEILDINSELYVFQPEITFLLIDLRSLIGNLFYIPYSISNEERKNIVDKKISEISNLISIFKKNSSSKLIISNFSIPTHSSYGISDKNNEFGFHEMIETLNLKLQEKIRTFNSVFLFDFNRFVNKFGENNVFNYRSFFFGDVKVDLNYLPELGNQLFSFIIAFLGISKKCIILDLDNTLWGGIVGEDGFDGIKLGKTPPGNAFHEFQFHLKALSERGIILSINSKNNFDDAMKVIKEHPDMVLRENDFSCIAINWENKIDNMKSISNQLNIGLDSFVFFDDDPVNRELIRKNLPDVLTPELPSDPSYFSKILNEINEFSLFKITDEDIIRNKSYSDQKRRIELESSSKNIDDFLNLLDLKLIFKKATDFTIPRISQLTLKTNQFNLTTKRYQENDIKEFSKDPNMLVGCIQVKDKFGDSGITGVFIVKKNNPLEWEVDTFLLSCRVMGREIEKGMMNYIIDEAKKNKVEKIKAKYIPSDKNKPIEKFLSSCDFEKDKNYWIYPTSKSFKNPEFLNITIE